MWMMVPAGQVTERTVRELVQRLDADDGAIDGAAHAIMTISLRNRRDEGGNGGNRVS
jgi:6-phosphogluconate dehydrogenase (decarboxylating)